MTKTNKDKYGGLLDKYMDDKHVDYRIKMECEKEAKNKYGSLLEKAKPNDTILNDILNVSNACRNIQQKKANEYEQANIRRQERIEREKREQQERTDRNNAFVNSYLEKKEAERKAAEKKRLEAEREQSFLNGIQRMINAKDEASEMIARTNAMLKRDEERRKAHEEKMEWHRRQERKG